MDSECYALWGSNDVKWVMRPAIGGAGGLLCIWKEDIFVLDECFMGEGSLGVRGMWKEMCVNVIIMNI